MTPRDIFEPISRQVFGELEQRRPSEQSGSGNTAAYGTQRRLGSDLWLEKDLIFQLRCHQPRQE
jgi:hypothetical protein